MKPETPDFKAGILSIPQMPSLLSCKVPFHGLGIRTQRRLPSAQLGVPEGSIWLQSHLGSGVGTSSTEKGSRLGKDFVCVFLKNENAFDKEFPLANRSQFSEHLQTNWRCRLSHSLLAALLFPVSEGP